MFAGSSHLICSTGSGQKWKMEEEEQAGAGVEEEGEDRGERWRGEGGGRQASHSAGSPGVGCATLRTANACLFCYAPLFSAELEID